MKPRLGIQLWSVKEAIQKEGFKEIIKRLAAMGYDGVEFAGYGETSAADMKRFLDEAGVVAIGPHAQYRLLMDDLEGQLAYVSEIGAEYITIPSIPGEAQKSEAAFRPLFENLVKLSRQVNEAGLTYSYHNHGFELVDLPEGSRIIDILVDEAPRETFHFQPDVYFFVINKLDPIAHLERVSGRMPLLHVKDAAPNEDITAAPGDGRLDLEGVVSTALRNGTQWLIVEYAAKHVGGDGMDAAESGLANLKKAAEKA